MRAIASSFTLAAHGRSTACRTETCSGCSHNLAMGFVYGGTRFLCPNCFASVVATTAEGQKPLGGTIAGAYGIRGLLDSPVIEEAPQPTGPTDAAAPTLARSTSGTSGNGSFCGGANGRRADGASDVSDVHPLFSSIEGTNMTSSGTAVLRGIGSLSALATESEDLPVGPSTTASRSAGPSLPRSEQKQPLLDGSESGETAHLGGEMGDDPSAHSTGDSSFEAAGSCNSYYGGLAEGMGPNSPFWQRAPGGDAVTRGAGGVSHDLPPRDLPPLMSQGRADFDLDHLMFSSDMELDEADAPFDATGAPFAKLQRLLGPHALHSELEAAAANPSEALPQAPDAMAAALQEERPAQRPRHGKSAAAVFGPTVYGGRGVYAILQQQGHQLAAESTHASSLNEGEAASNEARSSAMPAVAPAIRMVATRVASAAAPAPAPVQSHDGDGTTLPDGSQKKWACYECHKAKTACEGNPCHRCQRLGKTCIELVRAGKRQRSSRKNTTAVNAPHAMMANVLSAQAGMTAQAAMIPQGYNTAAATAAATAATAAAAAAAAAAASAAASLGIMPSDALGQTHSGVPPPGVALGMMPMYTPPQMATARVPQSLLPMASKPMLAQPHGAPGSNGSGAYPPPSAEPPSLMGRARVSVAATAISGTQVSQRVPATSAWVTEPAGTQKAPVTAPLVLSV